MRVAAVAGLTGPEDLVPRVRRRYGPAEIRRLHQIIALRSFGLPLAEIGPLLDGTGADPRDLLQRQLRRTEEQLARQREEAAAALTPEQRAALQRQREEQVGRLSLEELAAMQEHRRQMLPDGIA